MIQFPADVDRELVVAAPSARVYDLFCPERLNPLVEIVESYEPLAVGRGRWQLRERSIFGLPYRPAVTLAHGGNGRDHLFCRSEEGDLAVSLEVALSGDGHHTRVACRGTIAYQLPTSNMMEKVFRSKVVRAMREEIDRFWRRFEAACSF